MKLFSIILFAVIFNIQTINSQSIVEVVDSMKGGIYMSKYFGDYTEKVTSQWQLYESLKLIASKEDLIQLSSHKKPVIRCYAFQALWENKNPIVFNIFKKHLSDFETIYTYRGCNNTNEITVNEFMLELIGKRNYYLNTSIQVAFHRDSNNYKEMTFDEASMHFENIANEAMLYSKYLPDQYKTKLARIIDPKPKYYNRIKQLYLNSKQKERKLAIRGHTEELLLLLLTYQNPLDSKFIIPYLESKNVHILNSGILAVKKSTDPLLFGYLERMKLKFAAYRTVNHFHLYLYDYYEAIGLYQNKEAIELFNFILNYSTKENLLLHKKHIWLAIQNNESSIFDEFRESLNLTELDKREILKLKNQRTN